MPMFLTPPSIYELYTFSKSQASCLSCFILASCSRKYLWEFEKYTVLIIIDAFLACYRILMLPHARDETQKVGDRCSNYQSLILYGYKVRINP